MALGHPKNATISDRGVEINPGGLIEAVGPDLWAFLGTGHAAGVSSPVAHKRRDYGAEALRCVLQNARDLSIGGKIPYRFIFRLERGEENEQAGYGQNTVNFVRDIGQD